LLAHGCPFFSFQTLIYPSQALKPFSITSKYFWKWIAVADSRTLSGYGTDRLAFVKLPNDPRKTDAYVMTLHGSKFVSLKTFYSKQATISQSEMSTSGRRAPRSSKGYIRRAKVCLRKKEYKRVVNDLSKAIAQYPKSAEAYFNRGLALQRLGRPRRALKDFNKVAKLKPRMAHVYNHRAQVYTQGGKYDKALKDLETLSKLNPKWKLSSVINTGCVYIQKGQPDKAIECFNEAIKLKPKNSDQALIHLNIGSAYRRLGNSEKALREAELAANLAPKHSMPFVALGTIYTDLKEDDKALESFLKAIELEPRSFLGLLDLGIFYRRKKQFDKASEVFARIAEFYPENRLGYFQLGLTFEELRKYDKALEQYNKIHELDSKDAHIYTHKGIVYANLNNREESMRNLCRAIKLDRKEAIAYLSRGVLHLELGKYQAALDDFETSAKLRPDMPWAHFGKGKALCYLTNDKPSFKEKRKLQREVLDSFEKAEKNATDLEEKDLIKWWIEFFKKYCNASSENRKRLRVFAEIYEKAIEKGLFSKVFDEQNRLSKFLNLSKALKSERFFKVLRRWNSFTPIIPESSRSNLGGGYFFACDGQGIVIDPGYNFVENFMRCGFSLGDVDNIILTHAHDDHTADFEAILSLMSKLGKRRKISLFTNLSASAKFSHLLVKNEDSFNTIEILNENQMHLISPKLKMKATRAIHKDILTEYSARGLIFELEREKGVYRIGITGDTMFFKGTDEQRGLSSLFENMDVLVLHLGSIHKKEFEGHDDDFEVHKYEGAHLGVRGVVNLIAQCRPKLAIISEFGEELKELRTDMAFRIDDCFENYDSTGNTRVIPGDIGLTIEFNDEIKVKCEICGASVRLKDITYTETQINDKICYYCRNHGRREILDKFRKEEEKELRIRAESIGCATDLFFPSPSFAGSGH